MTEYESETLNLISPEQVFASIKENKYKVKGETPIIDIMSVKFETLMRKHTLATTIVIFMKKNTEFIIIMNEDKYPLGIVRSFDLLKHITEVLYVQTDTDSNVA